MRKSKPAAAPAKSMPAAAGAARRRAPARAMVASAARSLAAQMAVGRTGRLKSNARRRFDEVAGEDRAAEEDRQDRAPDEGGDEARGSAEFGGRDARSREVRHAEDEEAHRERGDEERPALGEVSSEEVQEAAHGQAPSVPA